MTEDDDVTSNKVVRQLEDRIRELERQLGRKALEAEILREADRWREEPSRVGATTRRRAVSGEGRRPKEPRTWCQ